MASYIPYSELKSFGYDLTSGEGKKFAEMCKRVENLLVDISHCFEGVKRPRVSMHVAREYDDEWIVSTERCIELRKLDPETDWQEVSKEKIEAYQEYFTFSDAEGWLFYLPAYMRHFLLEFPDEGYDAVCYATKEQDSRLEMLDEGQRGCVTEFAKLCEDYGV